MNKKELVNAISETIAGGEGRKNLSKLEIESCLEAFANVAAAELLGGGEVTLLGFGKVKARDTAARKARNPQTGEEITVPAGRKVVFTPTRELKDALKA